VSARPFRVVIEVVVVGSESCGTRWAKNHLFLYFRPGKVPVGRDDEGGANGLQDRGCSSK